MKGRIGWVIAPHLGGIVTIYKSLSAGLRARGWEILPVWAGVSPPHQGAAGLGEAQEFLAPGNSDPVVCAAEFVRWVRERGCDLLFSVNEPFVVAGLAAMPAHVRAAAKCPTQSGHSYRLMTQNLGRTDVILVETRREYEDLTVRLGVPQAKCALIMHGVDTGAFAPATNPDFGGDLRIICAGRVDNATKGVMLLPEICRRLRQKGVSFQLVVVGDGPDRERLQKRFERLGVMGRVSLAGTVAREQLTRFLQEAHVAVIPSVVEGGCFALLEYMACGCVPVVSHIRKTTDVLVRDGHNGYLCRMGDAAAFAAAIASLADDRDLLRGTSIAARQTIEDGFTFERMVNDYDRVLSDLLDRPADHPAPVPISEIRAPGGRSPFWRSHIPRPVKNAARAWAERFGVTL